MTGDYRKRIQEVFDSIENAFEEVDPDLAECEQSLGSVTITLADKSKCILSAQPSVHQLWLALASKGTAYHFNFEESANGSSGRWIDDKGRKIELISFLEKFLKESTGIDIKI